MSYATDSGSHVLFPPTQRLPATPPYISGGVSSILEGDHRGPYIWGFGSTGIIS